MTASDRRALASVVLAAIGLGLLGVGWWGVADQPTVDDQIPWLVVGGIGGMTAVSVAAYLFGSTTVRLDLDRLERLDRRILVVHTAIVGDDTATTEDTTDAADDGFVVLDVGTRFCRAGCVMVAGKAARPARATDLRQRDPCPMCRPHDAAV